MGAYAATVNRKLSDKAVRKLRERAARGEPDVELAVAFGVSAHAVCAIRTGVKRTTAGGPLTRRARPPATKLLRERIARALERGETQVQIAERERCAISTIARVAHPIVGVRRVESLEREVADLREEVAALRAVLSTVS